MVRPSGTSGTGSTQVRGGRLQTMDREPEPLPGRSRGWPGCAESTACSCRVAHQPLHKVPDPTPGSGRFNLVQGLVALAVDIGASLGNVVDGHVVHAFGDPAGILGLAGVALRALISFLVLMPETGEGDGGREPPPAAPAA